MNHKCLAIVLAVAAVSLLILYVLMPSCVLPLRGDVVICGGAVHVSVTHISHGQHVRIPFWWLSALLFIYPGIVLVRTLRVRRNRIEGHCRKCGYNLTGNVSGRCSECGAAI